MAEVAGRRLHIHFGIFGIAVISLLQKGQRDRQREN